MSAAAAPLFASRSRPDHAQRWAHPPPPFHLLYPLLTRLSARPRPSSFPSRSPPRRKSAEAHALRPCLGQRQVIAGVAQPYEFITYREAAERVAALASGFAGLGLKAGDRVGIFGPNCLEWMLAMQARARKPACRVREAGLGFC
jgi:non-ribosomal peptide synthetase component F